jgi:hypothetical protein
LAMTTNATDIFWACKDFKHLFDNLAVHRQLFGLI